MTFLEELGEGGGRIPVLLPLWVVLFDELLFALLLFVLLLPDRSVKVEDRLGEEEMDGIEENDTVFF